MWRDALADPDVEAFVAEDDGKAGRLRRRPRRLPAQPLRRAGRVGAAASAPRCTTSRSSACAPAATREAKLWTLEENWNGRRFYENRGWTLNGETRVVPFPPNPIDVGYCKEL